MIVPCSTPLWHRELHYAYFFNDRRLRQRERQGYRQGRQPVAFPGAIAGFVAQAVFTGLIELSARAGPIEVDRAGHGFADPCRPERCSGDLLLVPCMQRRNGVKGSVKERGNGAAAVFGFGPIE